MNKKQNLNNAEQKVLIKNFLRGLAAIEYEYNPQSARKQEERYASYGIKLPFKIFYEYKMPCGFESSYDLLFWLPFGLGRAKLLDRNISDLYKTDVGNLSSKEKKKIDFYKQFSSEQLKTVFEWIGRLSSEDVIREIKRLNPELAHIKTDNRKTAVSNTVQDFICGVAYGFAPDDIDFCLSATREEFLKVLNDPRMQVVNHGHVPTPVKLDVLVAAEEQIKIKKLQRNNGRE